MTGPGTGEQPSLVEQMRRLEEIVRRLESDDTDLDQALLLFAEGVDRLRAAQSKLSEAQVAVEKVVAAVFATPPAIIQRVKTILQFK